MERLIDQSFNHLPKVEQNMPDRAETADLAQIGLTPEGEQNLDAVMHTNWFATAQDAYRLAISVALANNVIATNEQVRGSATKYNFAGGVDKDGRVRALIGIFRPQDATLPARTAERLAHAGLAILAEKLARDEALLSEAIGYQEKT